MEPDDIARRRFLQASSATFGATWLAAHWPGLVSAAAEAHAAAAGGTDPVFRLLTSAQARDIDALASQIVPSGESPGAREAGVVYFVDRVLSGTFQTEAGDVLAELKAFQRDFAERHPAVTQFADLPAAAQLEYLKSVETTPFFARMRFLTVLGLLSLPSYGGNRNRIGWSLAGFDDRHAWEPPFGHYDRDYPGFEPYPKEPRK